MQISKKLYTTLIITVLTLSTLMAAIPMASAEIDSAPYLYAKGTTTPISSGKVGTKVDVASNSTSGRADPFSTVTVYWDALSGTVLGTGDADSNGDYTISVTIPPAVFGEHWIVVNDGETESAGVSFDVTARLVVNSIPPTFWGDPKALPGDSVTVTGDGFAANDDITLFFNSTTLSPAGSFEITTPTITTDGTGSFSATIQIPATLVLADFDTYDANATDEAGNSAIDQIVIDYYISCTPGSGPRGITTTISGRIAPSVSYEIRFNGAPIASGTTTSDGSYANDYTIPGVLSETSYAVEIWWDTTKHRDTTFTVTASPTIVVTPNNDIAGATVGITGSGFIAGSNITLYFASTVVNSTAMGTGFGPVIAAGPYAGTFDLTFVVPSLTPGIYAVSVVDQYGATSAAGVYFTINPTPVFTIQTRSTQYMRDDTISLVSYATSDIPVLLEITDPNGLVFYQWYYIHWQSLGSHYELPYDATYLNMYPIPSDAPTGVWNFTCYDYYTSAILDTNVFTVSVKPNMQTVIDEIDECCANMSDLLDALEATITGVVTDSEGDLTALINTKAGSITTKLDPLMPKLQGIEDTAVIIATMLGEVQVDIAALDLGTMGVDITAIKGDVAIIKSNIGTVTTSVATLDAKVVALSGDVATVSTTLGTLEGTVTAIDGKIATVNTSVGTVQADVSDIKAKPDVDMTPVWIAVVLSLIAAIAACFAVVTIRQKIAG